MNSSFKMGVVPTGVVFPWAGASAPSSYLLCDGSSYATADYPGLYGVIGYTYGGSGANFNVPDLRGRVPLGKDNMGGSSADRVTSAQADALGGASGAEAHTLVTSEMPAHTHSGVPGTYGMIYTGGAGTWGWYNTGSTSSNGGDTAHNNVQPYLTLNYIIKI